jgi:hypothetical protein
MNRNILLPLLFLSIISLAQQNKNELALSISPLHFEDAESYQMLYRRSFKNDKMIRAGAQFLADTRKETRTDTIAKQFGSVKYNLSLGYQRNFEIEDLDRVYLYGAADGYWNSEFNRKSYESYYGYYWNIGVKPIAGITYEPFDNIRLSIEAKADCNINLQQYSALGVNKDEVFSFSPLRQLGLNFGYLF